MTDPTDPRLDALDRRAATAVAELDRAVADLPVPDAPAPARRRRFPAPLLVAASILVVVVAAAALITSSGDERGTIAGEPERTGRVHLVLADPADDGYDVAAVFDRERPSSVSPGIDLPVTVQASSGAEDPWARALVEYALPSDSTTLDGETVDLDGTPGVYREGDGLRSVGWEDGDQTRYLVSTALGRVELVGAARQSAAADAGIGGPIAEHEILFRGTLGDVFQSQTTLPPPGTSGVVYTGRTEQTSYLMVRTTMGSEDNWRAAQVLAVERTATTARGHDAVVVTGPEGLTEISWMEDERNLVRVSTSAPTLDLDLPDRLRVITDDEFAALLDEHGGDAPEPSLPGDGGDESEADSTEVTADLATPVASVRSGDGDTVVEATLGRLADGTHLLELEHSGPGEGAASDVSLPPGLDSPRSLRVDLGDGRVAVAGIIGPSRTGDVFLGGAFDEVAHGAIGPSSATIEGSDSVLFLAVVPPGVDLAGWTAVTTAPDGSTVTLPLDEG